MGLVVLVFVLVLANLIAVIVIVVAAIIAIVVITTVAVIIVFLVFHLQRSPPIVDLFVYYKRDRIVTKVKKIKIKSTTAKNQL